MKCPCCGQEARQDILLDPARYTITNEKGSVKVGRRRFRILEALIGKMGKSLNALCDTVYADDPNGGPGNPEVTVRTQVHYLRVALKPLGLTVISTRGPGAVYRLENVG